MRRASTVAPDPIRLSWLIIEFAERHRPGAIKARRIFTKEIRLLVQAMQEIGDPLVAELGEVDSHAFRAMSPVGVIRTETLIRRLRQIWRWANSEAFADRACPWHAHTRERQIRVEMVELVARYLPEVALQEIGAMALASCVGSGARAGEDLVSLTRAVRQAARQACMEAWRDGRPDLIPALRRCDLQWFLEAKTPDASQSPTAGELILGHERIEVVDNLRKKASTGRKILAESNPTDQDVQ
ncbi:hypothetical protein [Pandoraea terrae]|nr:hypothetical protein [Pandoraea terrae]